MEIGLTTNSSAIESLIRSIKKIAERKEIEDSHVLLSDITAQALIIIVDYFTAPVTINEFNTIKQEINLSVVKLMEELAIEIAGANTDVRIIGQEK